MFPCSAVFYGVDERDGGGPLQCAVARDPLSCHTAVVQPIGLQSPPCLVALSLFLSLWIAHLTLFTCPLLFIYYYFISFYSQENIWGHARQVVCCAAAVAGVSYFRPCAISWSISGSSVPNGQSRPSLHSTLPRYSALLVRLAMTGGTLLSCPPSLGSLDKEVPSSYYVFQVDPARRRVRSVLYCTYFPFRNLTFKLLSPRGCSSQKIVSNDTTSALPHICSTIRLPGFPPPLLSPLFISS